MSDDVLTRPAPPPDAAVRYGEAPEHVADLHLPPGGGGPLVVLVHGGFWKAAWDRAHLAPMASALAQAGHLVAVPEYRRVGMPGGGWPGTALDVAAAVSALPGLVGDHAGERPAPLVLVGHSAGGHLAAWTALRARVPCAGVLSLAGVLDLPLAARLRLGGGAVQALLGGEPDERTRAYSEADPLDADPLNAVPQPAAPGRSAPGVPVTLVHGTRDDDVPVEVSRAFAARHPGARVREIDADHYDLIDPASPAWPVVVAEVARLAGLPKLRS